MLGKKSKEGSIGRTFNAKTLPDNDARFAFFIWDQEIKSFFILYRKNHPPLKVQIMKKNGFTLIELLIAFIILGIATAIAIPGFSRWMPSYRLKSATRDLYSNMQLAKMGAVKNNADWAVVFNVGANSYRICSDIGGDKDWTNGNETVEKTVNLSDYGSGVSYGQGTVTIPIDASRPLGDSVTFDDEKSDNGNDVVVFNSRGMINEQENSGGEAYISNSNNSTYAVVCLPTGVILMRTWTGAAWE